MMNKRIKRLERMIPRKQDSGPDKPDLSPLSVPELKELEGFIIKQDRGESFTDTEIERINTIMAKTKST